MHATRMLHGKNGFAEVCKNLAKYRTENNLDHQNNYVGRLSVDDNAVKCFYVLSTSLNVLHNYFDGLNQIIFRSMAN